VKRSWLRIAHKKCDLADGKHGLTELSAAYAYALGGRHDEARALLRRVFDSKPRLAEWMHRMIAAGIIPHDSVLVDTIASMRIRSAAH
jgi:hypothetical protein